MLQSTPDQFSGSRMGVQKHKMSTIVGGAFAGLAVDMTLFPLDTIKTRLQSGIGFKEAGGFRSIYAGVPSILIGSAPGSAIFFITYESIKNLIRSGTKKSECLAPSDHFRHLVAASVGETIACLVRVPTEVIKQRAQSFPNTSTGVILERVLENEGVLGLYRGFVATLAREIPFAAIQFPLWENFKYRWAEHKDGPLSLWQGATCGSAAGAVAAAITTPLDVIKTRIMISQKLYTDRPSFRFMAKDIWKTRGIRGLYAGCLPRTLWMALGGLIFFGAYESASSFYEYAMIEMSEENYVDTHKKTSFLFFHSLLSDLFYKAFFEYNAKDENLLKTFDDVVRDAKRAQTERDEFARKQLMERENENLTTNR